MTAVPTTTRLTPVAIAVSIAARERSPPPRWTVPGKAAAMLATSAACTGWPSRAPSRLTTWSTDAPASAKARACATGSSLKTVDWAKSPRRSRTARPSCRSIAG